MNKELALKIFLYVFFVFLIILQISFINTSTGILKYFNLILIILFLLLFISRPYNLLFYVLTAGFLFDLYSQFSFGIYLIVFSTVLLILYLLLKNILTHYSTLSLASLIALGTLSFNLLLFALTKIINLANLNNYYFHLSLGLLIGQIIINLFFILIISQIFKLMQKKLWFKYEN